MHIAPHKDTTVGLTVTADSKAPRALCAVLITRSRAIDEHMSRHSCFFRLRFLHLAKDKNV